MEYFRPIPLTDPARPAEALTLAGGWCWFDRVEILARGRAPRVVPASALDAGTLAPLTAPRAAFAGLALDRPQIMGVINVTPDSFSDGGAFLPPDAAVAQAMDMDRAGADVIDIGGESTRPGAVAVAEADEIARIQPVIARLRDAGLVAPISIDTRKAGVAQAALGAGAAIVNDVSALRFDPGLAGVVAKSDCPVILMHSIATPASMQDDPRYDDVLLDVYDALDDRIRQAEAAGIARARIMVDPGIGFGKTVAHNLALLSRLSLFHGLGCPVLLGASRKRFIGTVGRAPEARGRMPGSIAVALAGVAQGVQMVRVHDVAETRQALALWQAVTVDAGT